LRHHGVESRATLLDVGDGVALLKLHGKMNAGDGALDLIDQSLDLVDRAVSRASFLGQRTAAFSWRGWSSAGWSTLDIGTRSLRGPPISGTVAYGPLIPGRHGAKRPDAGRRCGVRASRGGAFRPAASCIWGSLKSAWTTSDRQRQRTSFAHA
jgi:hypothetical protein